MTARALQQAGVRRNAEAFGMGQDLDRSRHAQKLRDSALVLLDLKLSLLDGAAALCLQAITQALAPQQAQKQCLDLHLIR